LGGKGLLEIKEKKERVGDKDQLQESRRVRPWATRLRTATGSVRLEMVKKEGTTCLSRERGHVVA